MLALNPRAQAQVGDSMVETWYGDVAKAEFREGKQVNHRRWLRVLRSDGTFTIVFRYDFNNRLQVEAIDHDDLTTRLP